MDFSDLYGTVCNDALALYTMAYTLMPVRQEMLAVGRMLTPRERWVEEGLDVLATGGPDAVRIEVLAQRLGVTKGGFYGQFKNREALLQEMLETWEREAVDDVLAAIERAGRDPETTAIQAGELTFSSQRFLPLDLAIRAWARTDGTAAARVRAVDNKRMGLLRRTFDAFCDDPDEVEARSLLAFSAALSAHLLAADHGGRTREQVHARAIDILFGRA